MLLQIQIQVLCLLKHNSLIYYKSQEIISCTDLDYSPSVQKGSTQPKATHWSSSVQEKLLLWDGLWCCSGWQLRSDSGTCTATVPVPVVFELLVTETETEMVIWFAKSCCDKEEAVLFLLCICGRISCLVHAPRKCIHFPLNMIKHLKYKVKNNRKLHRRKASVYSSLKERPGRNCAPKWSGDLKNYRVLWQRMRKRKKGEAIVYNHKKQIPSQNLLGLPFFFCCFTHSQH